MILDLYDETLRLQVGHHSLRASKRSRPAYAPAAAVILRVFADHPDERKLVTAACFEVVRIVRGSDFDDAGPELGVGHRRRE